MKQHIWLTILRWLCVLPAVGLSFIACLFVSARISPIIFTKLLNFGLVSLVQDGGPRYDLLWNGPFAAIFFVLSGAWVAPGYRRIVALSLFALGAYLTPGFVEEGSMPLYNPATDANRLCMYWSIATTYMGGALAVAAVFIATRKPSSAAWSK